MAAPLLTYRLSPPPQKAMILRGALFGGAVMIALTGLLLPHIAPVDPIVGYVLLAVALMDVGLAFILPGIIMKQGAAGRALFFNERLEISVGRQSYSLFYDNISGVEEAPPAGGEAGLTDIILFTSKPARIPLLSDAQRLRLSGLPAAEDPLSRIKELVEKSCAA